MIQIAKKVTVVGDHETGKSALLNRLIHSAPPKAYVPTIFENHDHKIQLKKYEITLKLWDTAGQEDYQRLSHITYTNTDIFMIVFSIVNPRSFRNIEEKWLPELKYFLKTDVKFVLVGTKKDLRNDTEILEELVARGIKPVEYEHAKAFARNYGARYYECSALTGENVKNIFEQIGMDALKEYKREHRCSWCKNTWRSFKETFGL